MDCQKLLIDNKNASTKSKITSNNIPFGIK